MEMKLGEASESRETLHETERRMNARRGLTVINDQTQHFTMKLTEIIKQNLTIHNLQQFKVTILHSTHEQ